MAKDKISKAMREQIWLHHFGKQFEVKCPIRWCQNKITVFEYHMGHNVPEAEGGEVDFDNLLPICSRCNSGMNKYLTIDEWNELAEGKEEGKEILIKKVKKKDWKREKKALRKESWSCCGLF